jgi:hypothetical protein
VGRVHVRLDLEDERGERAVERARLVLHVEPRRRPGGQVDDGVEQHADAEVGQRRADEQRRGVAGEVRLDVEIGADGVEQADLVLRRLPRRALLGRRNVVRNELLGRQRGTAIGAGEADVLAGAAVDDAAEVAGDADRPRHRRRAQADLGLDLVEQLERLAARAVVLVEEREHGEAPGPTDLEQLERLRLDALGRVEHHHHRVDAGEDPVRVLREVAVAGRVEQVDHVVAVRELQHRRADRDAPLALELHPVRRRRPPSVARFDGPCSLHGAGVEQELLGERRLAGVGVADDGEGPAAGRLAHHQVLVHDRSTLSATSAGPSGCGP